AVSGTSPSGIAAADRNGDGKPDLATANYGNGTVSVLLNDGAGGFAAGVAYPAFGGTGFGLYDITAADLNGDGRQDLAVANHNYGRVGVYLGKGDGTLLPGQNYNVNAIAVAAGGFNADGPPHLASGRYSNNSVT